MTGIGRDALRIVPVDNDLRMNVDALGEQLRADRAAGDLPVIVVATAAADFTCIR